MSRVWTVAAIAATAIAAAAIGTELTAQAASAPPTSASTARSWHLHASVDQTSGLNKNGVPGRLGARGTLHAVLHGPDHPGSRIAGDVELELQVTSTTYPSTILQIGTIQLRHGTLAIQGMQAENQQTSRLAVTGGTGAYVGAVGTVQVGSDGSVTITVAKP